MCFMPSDDMKNTLFVGTLSFSNTHFVIFENSSSEQVCRWLAIACSIPFGLFTVMVASWYCMSFSLTVLVSMNTGCCCVLSTLISICIPATYRKLPANIGKHTLAQLLSMSQNIPRSL